MNKSFKAILTACALLTLTACGGSDEPDSSNSTIDATTLNKAPTLTLSSISEVEEGKQVMIRANATDSDGTVASYQWVQISGTAAQLVNTDLAELTFTAPQVDGSDDLVFEVLVKDNQGASVKGHSTIKVVDEVIETVGRALEKLVETGVMPKLDTSDDIAGPDLDDNGIRDDIDNYISTLPISIDKKNLLSEHARHVQLSITVEPNDHANEEVFARNLVLSYICYIRAFDSSEKDDARDYRKNIQSFTANTYERAKRLHQYDLSRNGSVISLPPADACSQ